MDAIQMPAADLVEDVTRAFLATELGVTVESLDDTLREYRDHPDLEQDLAEAVDRLSIQYQNDAWNTVQRA